MGLAQGLASLEAMSEAQSGSRADIEWFALDDGKSTFIRFVQELDESSENYNEEKGLAAIATIHQAKGHDGWKTKALCTADEGECWPCEQWENGDKDYGLKARLYINVLEDGVVKVWNAQRAVAKFLVEAHNEDGSITNREFKVTRKGKGKDTSYVMYPKAEDKEPFDFSDVEAVDVTKLVKHVPYAEQEAFYTGAEVDAEDEDELTF